MRKLTFTMLVVFVALGLSALHALEIFTVNSASRTLSRIDSQTNNVDNSFAQLGLTPNLMDLDADYLYVVCSGDNAIQVLDRVSGTHIRYIPVAASCNPYDVLKVGENLYVSGLFTDKLYRISLQSNSVTGVLSVGAAPEGLAYADGKLYICNTGGYSNNYANSSVSVVDLGSFTVTATIPVWTNPQYAVVRGNYLHVSCTGNWSDVNGKVDVIDLTNLERVQRLDIGGNPGSLWMRNNGTAYISEGMGSALYSYNADTYTVYNNTANPLPYDAYTISGTDDRLVLLDQNWDNNSVVRVYDNYFTLLHSYDVGYSSTDMLVADANPSSADDHIAEELCRLYPNPLPRGGVLRLEQRNGVAARFELFNVRGQLVQNTLLKGKTSTLQTDKLSSGVYLYRVEQGKSLQSGKLLIQN